VLPEPVIDRQVAGQPAVALLRVREGHGIGPFLSEGLDVDAVGRRPCLSALPLVLVTWTP